MCANKPFNVVLTGLTILGPGKFLLLDRLDSGLQADKSTKENKYSMSACFQVKK